MNTYGVIKFQAPFERLKEYSYTPEVRLYKAILTQATIDISNSGHNKEAKRIALETKIWIFGNSKDFQEVCQLAEINPSFMISLAKEAIKLNSTKRPYHNNKMNNSSKDLTIDSNQKKIKNQIYSHL